MKHLFFIFFTFLVFSASGQSTGLVLSGGGAKGLYHIGIIKALEEEGIPIDYVSGTSMGSIVAGLYAIGYTPDQMVAIFKSEQFKYWMTGKIESRYNYYFKNMDDRAAMVTLNLDLKSEKSVAVFPTNLIPSTQIDMAFNEIFGPAYAASNGNFDNLFVPFRCIASDVYNKREVVFRKGDIGSAIRASMTIPLVFKPLMQDSVLLYDGGIYNNFPWQVLVKDFNPDVLIGGKCVSANRNPDPSSIVDQVESLMMMHTDYNLPDTTDVLIDRVFADVGILDFSKVDYVVDCGYRDTKAQMDRIKSVIHRRISSEELHNRRLAYRASLPQLIFDDYHVTGLNPPQTAYVNKLLGLGSKEKNGDTPELFSFQQFKSDYFKILSEGDILGDYPQLGYNDSTGHFSISIDMRTKPSFRLMLGGNISSVSLNQAYVGMEYKSIGKRANSFRFDGTFSGLYTSVGGTVRTDFFLRKPYYSEITASYNAYNYTKTLDKTFLRDGYSRYTDSYISAALGFPMGRSSVFKVRGNLGINNYYYYDTPLFDDTKGKDRTNFRFYGFQAEAARRTFNYVLYPTRGTYQSASVIFVSGRNRFTAGDSSADAGMKTSAHEQWFGARFMREEYFPVTKWFSVGYLVDLLYTTHPSFGNSHATNFTSPGFTPTPHSQTVYIDKYRSKSYLGVGVMPTFEFTESFYLKNSFYLFMPKEYVEFGDVSTSTKVRYIASSSLVYQTPIGPASLTFTNYDTGRSSWFVVFNFGFTIFNRKGLFY